MVRIIKLPEVLSRRGKSRTQHYADIAAGLFTPPVKLSVRASGWPDTETDALVRATIAGKSASEIRQLVRDLEAARQAGA
jgi:prophage regulatory protein